MMYSVSFTGLYKDQESMSVAWFIKPCLSLFCAFCYRRKQVNLFDRVDKNW